MNSTLMAEERLNVVAESTVASPSQVMPILDHEASSLEASDTIIVMPPEDDGFSGELDPQDRWLPVTESRNGSTLTAAFHLLCSGIGIQALLLPAAFVSLGW